MTAGLANSNYKVVTSKGTFLLKICEEGRLDKIQVRVFCVLFARFGVESPMFRYIRLYGVVCGASEALFVHICFVSVCHVAYLI